MLRLTGSAEDALDLLQDAFLRAFEKLDRFQGESSFYTWVYRIAVNLALSGRRRRRVTLRFQRPGGDDPLDPPDDPILSDPTLPLERAERDELIQSALNALADDHRAVVVMKEFDGLRYEEIAAILGVPVGTVRSRLHRARLDLRERLKGFVARGRARLARPPGTPADSTLTRSIVGTNERQEARVSQALTPPDVMNLDDESHLSAYLDDELDPADRLAVEWSVESSPPAGRSAPLARPGPGRRGRPRPALDPPRPRPHRWGPARRRPSTGPPPGRWPRPARRPRLLGLLLDRRQPDLRPHPPPPIAPPDPRATDRRRPERAGPGASHSSHDPSDPAPIPIQPSPKLADRQIVSTQAHREDLPGDALASMDPPAPPGEVSEREDRRLDRPDARTAHVRRIVIVTDVIDASDQIRDLIQQDARQTPEFGRITICQNLVIDPDRPEAAEVFAVPMDEGGRRSFVERLQRMFPNLVEEGRSNPELVTQLSEVGQVAIFRGTEAAPLGDPPFDSASSSRTASRSHPRSSSGRSTGRAGEFLPTGRQRAIEGTAGVPRRAGSRTPICRPSGPRSVRSSHASP